MDSGLDLGDHDRGAGPGRWHARLLLQWSVFCEALRGRGLGLSAVLFGIGVGAYLGAWQEPRAGAVFLAWTVLFMGAACAAFGPPVLRPLVVALAMLAAGFAVAALRTDRVAASVLDGQRYGAIQGRVVMIDRGSSGAPRMTLDRVYLPDTPPLRTPARVRVSLHGQAADRLPEIGTTVLLTGFLGPPSGPSEPGGFDFRRMAWFERLGAVGYTRTPVMTRAPPDLGWGVWITQVRLTLAAAIRGGSDSQSRAFVAAILTGDRSGISAETTEALRQTNLSHLLAISGLHMGLLTATVYGVLRGGLALWPWAALWLPIRKLAATGALLSALVYLALSGGNVATQRAFIMAGAMLVAVLLDRRALSLRTVAVAALILLLWRPEALVSAGFQMSFAATIALVACFSAWRKWRQWQREKGHGAGRPGWMQRLAAPVISAALCSTIAGLATAPIAAAHFGRFADYGLLANVLAVPLMGTLMMPAALLSAVLWPLGAQDLGLWLMERAADWILAVAHAVAGLEGASRLIIEPPGWVLPVLALGGLWLVLIPGRARAIGVLPAVIALGAWFLHERPLVLIDGRGQLVGVRFAGPLPSRAAAAPGAGALTRARDATERRPFVPAPHWFAALTGDQTGEDRAISAAWTPATYPQPPALHGSGSILAHAPLPFGARTLSRGRGASFVASGWAESDADAASQADAAQRSGRWDVPGGSLLAWSGGYIVHLHGRAGQRALAETCATLAQAQVDAAVADRARSARETVDEQPLRAGQDRETSGFQWQPATGRDPARALPPFLVVTDFWPRGSYDPGCPLLHPGLLRETGALAVGAHGDLQATDPTERRRPWMRP